MAGMYYWRVHHTRQNRIARTAGPDVIQRDDPRHSFPNRFGLPRIVRQRPDKPSTEIDTLQRVEELFARQNEPPAAAKPAEPVPQTAQTDPAAPARKPSKRRNK